MMECKIGSKKVWCKHRDICNHLTKIYWCVGDNLEDVYKIPMPYLKILYLSKVLRGLEEYGFIQPKRRGGGRRIIRT